MTLYQILKIVNLTSVFLLKQNNFLLKTISIAVFWILQVLIFICEKYKFEKA